MAVRLIVNADDFGMTPGVTRGIARSIRDGIVSSTSLMTNMASAAEATRLAVQCGLDVGVHLNLTTGRPLLCPSRIPSLVQGDGSFYPYREFVQRLCRQRITMRDVRLEFDAQVEAALRMGIQPSHLDTHHHLHAWLPISVVFLRVGRRFGIDKTRTTRTIAFGRLPLPLPAAMREWAARRYKAATARILGTWFRMATWRAEPSAVSTKRNGRLKGWLMFVEALRGWPSDVVVEAPCHPGYVDDELSSCATYVDGREDELAALTSPELKEALAEAGIEVLDFRKL